MFFVVFKGIKSDFVLVKESFLELWDLFLFLYWQKTKLED